MTQKTAAIGIDLGGTNLRCALVCESGEIVKLVKEKTPVKEGPKATALLMAGMCRELLSHSKNYNVAGVGIGSPGPLSRFHKKIYQTPNLPGFDSYPLGEDVEKLTSLKVFLDNDAKCAAIGEKVFGQAKNMKNFVLMTLGTGIGGGIFNDGKMIYGKSDGACEIGHMTLYPGGLQCKCGNLGCFEQYCSATAIEGRASKARQSRCTAIELFDFYTKNTAWAVKCVEEIVRDLAIATASFVNMFDPEAIIFAGGIFTTGGGPLLPLVGEEIKTRCFLSSQENLKLLASSLGGEAGVLGAASIVFHQSI